MRQRWGIAALGLRAGGGASDGSGRLRGKSFHGIARII